MESTMTSSARRHRRRRSWAPPPVRAWALLALASAGCVSTELHVYNEAGIAVSPANGERHVITYLRLYEEDGALVLYGRVEHGHDGSFPEGHVDIALIGADGRVVHGESAPLRRTGRKRHGYSGASFRAKVEPLPDTVVSARIEVHDWPGESRFPGETTGSR